MKEEAIENLKRWYISGAITIEEFERELDNVFNGKILYVLLNPERFKYTMHVPEGYLNVR